MNVINEIKEYQAALIAHMDAKRQEIVSRVEVNRTHHRLLVAKDTLRSREIDALQDIERS